MTSADASGALFALASPTLEAGPLGLHEHWFPGRLDCRSGLVALQVMEQGGGDIGGGEALFEEALDEMVLAPEFTAAQGVAKPVEEDAGAGFFDLGGGRRFAALHFYAGEPLDLLDLKEFAAGGEGDGASAAAGAARAAQARQGNPR